jgi:hypothetical protein
LKKLSLCPKSLHMDMSKNSTEDDEDTPSKKWPFNNLS